MYLVESEKSKNFSFQFGHFQFLGHLQGVHKVAHHGGKALCKNTFVYALKTIKKSHIQS